MNKNTNNIKNRIANNRLIVTKKLAERKQALDNAKRLRDEVRAIRKANKHLQQEIKTAEKLDIIDQALRDLNSK